MKNIKQNKKKLTIGIIILIAIIGFTIYQSTLVQKEKSNIVGTWVEENDSNWKLQFNSQSKCFWYYTGEATEEYTYTIQNTSPQCGLEVDTGNNFTYLQLNNINDSTEKICYEILSLNDEYLQLRMIKKGGFIRFKKQ